MTFSSIYAIIITESEEKKLVKVLQLEGNPRVIQCPCCKAILYYEITDIHWDKCGKNDFIGCPLCDEAIFSIPESRSNDTEGKYD